MIENKKSFFLIELNIRKFNSEFAIEKINDDLDIILGSLNVKNRTHRFLSNDKKKLCIFFETDQRKRKGQIVNNCEKKLDENVEFKVQGLVKQLYTLDIERLNKNKNFKNIEIERYNPYDDYEADDLKIFANKKNWHSWQKSIYNKIFDENGQYLKADTRRIISIVDSTGKTGKSSFFKFLYKTHHTTIGPIPIGTAAQLRSCAIALGKRNFYIIDLTRARSKEDSQDDLLSAVESIKNGVIQSSLYGKGEILLMEPPHIVITSNFVLKYDLLSKDRWDVFEINKKLELKKLEPSRIQRKLIQQEKNEIKEILIKKRLKNIIKKEVRQELLDKN